MRSCRLGFGEVVDACCLPLEVSSTLFIELLVFRFMRCADDGRLSAPRGSAVYAVGVLSSSRCRSLFVVVFLFLCFHRR